MEVTRQDLEIRGGRAARAGGGTYVIEHDAVGNEAAAIRAVAEAAVINPTWFSAWSGTLTVPVTDSYGNKFSVTMPGLTAVSGYLCMLGPQPVASFPKWDRDYSWPAAQLSWPSNVLRFRISYTDYGPVPAMTLPVSVVAWGTR